MKGSPHQKMRQRRGPYGETEGERKAVDGILLRKRLEPELRDRLVEAERIEARQ